MIDRFNTQMRLAKVIEIVEKITLTGGIKVFIAEGSRYLII